jgi:glutamine synthetase
LFSGDGYSSEWVKEANRRGLPNVKSYIESTQILSDPSVVNLFTSLDIYTATELNANRKIMEDLYVKTMDIEIRTLREMVRKDILPAMVQEYRSYEEASFKKQVRFIQKRKEQLAELVDQTYEGLEKLDELWKEANKEKDDFQCGKKYYYSVSPQMELLRSYIDRYEEISSRHYYTLPLYEDMLFGL